MKRFACWPLATHPRSCSAKRHAAIASRPHAFRRSIGPNAKHRTPPKTYVALQHSAHILALGGHILRPDQWLLDAPTSSTACYPSTKIPWLSGSWLCPIGGLAPSTPRAGVPKLRRTTAPLAHGACASALSQTCRWRRKPLPTTLAANSRVTDTFTALLQHGPTWRIAEHRGGQNLSRNGYLDL
jgi:hypothetical protein